MNGNDVAAYVGPKPESLGAIVTQPLTLLSAERAAEIKILHAKL
jgi:hypothetical protein